MGKLTNTIKTGINKGRKTIEDSLSKIETKLNNIKRTGSNKKGIKVDLKVVKKPPPPRPPVESVHSAVLRPGPPYNDQILIQKFINNEIDKDRKWVAKKHVVPLQGKFKNAHSKELKDKEIYFY